MDPEIRTLLFPLMTMDFLSYVTSHCIPEKNKTTINRTTTHKDLKEEEMEGGGQALLPISLKQTNKLTPFHFSTYTQNITRRCGGKFEPKTQKRVEGSSVAAAESDGGKGKWECELSSFPSLR